MQMMEEIQTSRIKRDEASVFVRDLECLHLIDWGDTFKFEKDCINAFEVDCAIISYPWNQPRNEPKVAGSWFVEDGRRSIVPDYVWRRAADYMRGEKVEYLWIDAECIAQEDSEAKAKAISEMDWLYHHGSHPFGMLTRTVREEIELHLLAQVLQGEDFSLKKGNTAEAWPAIRLMGEITSDIWWTRAWIYQENYHGGKRMDLLMPHERGLETLKAEYADLFGNLRGELIINSVQLSGALTDLCQAFISSNPPRFQKGLASQIISRAGRYSALLKRQSSMSPTIIADIGKRNVTNHPDRLDISANCCSYNIRLNRDKLNRETHSVSVAILVLFLLNGEIFSETSPGTMSPFNLTVVEFINRYAFKRFSPPSQGYELTFNKSCRFVDPSIAGDGVHTCGHLWQLCRRTIKISSEQAKEWRTVETTLWGLQKYLEEDEYIDERHNLDKLAHSLKKLREMSLQTPAHDYMWKMAKTLAAALKSGSTLRLGYLCSPPGISGRSSPTAVFICPDEAMDCHGPSFVFTSFRAKKTSDGPGYNDVDKHVSLQVHLKRRGSLPPNLSAQAWMHGLWFCEEMAQPVVFPLPRILREL